MGITDLVDDMQLLTLIFVKTCVWKLSHHLIFSEGPDQTRTDLFQMSGSAPPCCPSSLLVSV